jgi:lactoylglutathione lyase
MKFCWCTITTNDLDASIAFYRDIVGLALTRRFAAGPDTQIAFLGSGETQIEVIQSGSEATVGSGISLGFEVDSVDEMMTFVKEKGIPIHSGPMSPNPHVRFFYVQDPNGLKIQFVENM